MRIRTYGVVRGVMLKHPPTRFCGWLIMAVAACDISPGLHRGDILVQLYADISGLLRFRKMHNHDLVCHTNGKKNLDLSAEPAIIKE